MDQEHVRAPEWNRNAAQAVPERDLHHAEHANRHQVSQIIMRKLPARTGDHLPEFG
jgi:hypothetical protein